MFLMKEFVLSLKEKNTQHLFLLSKCPQVLKSFMTDPLNIIFDDLRIWLLGYRIEFSCLYTCIPKGLYFISTLWVWSTDEYVVVFKFERKSTFNDLNYSVIICFVLIVWSKKF